MPLHKSVYRILSVIVLFIILLLTVINSNDALSAVNNSKTYKGKQNKKKQKRRQKKKINSKHLQKPRPSNFLDYTAKSVRADKNSFLKFRDYNEALPANACNEIKNENSPDLRDRTVQVVYLHPKGFNRIKKYSTMMQRDARWVDAIFRRETNSKRRVAWDKGGACGNGYLDIIQVELPEVRKYYLNKDIGEAQYDAEMFLYRKFLYSNKHYLVYLDGISNNKNNYKRLSGISTSYSDKTDGIENRNNNYANRSYLIGYGNSDKFVSFYNFPNYQRAAMIIHELLHGLGASSPEAPGASRYQHCYDANDVLCYNDGFLPQGRLLLKCKSQRIRIDCNRDTYFSVNPAQNSWLYNNWNTADSPYLIGSDLSDREESFAEPDMMSASSFNKEYIQKYTLDKPEMITEHLP